MPKVSIKANPIDPHTPYTILQVAQIMGVRPSTVNEWRDDGRLCCSKIGHRTIRVMGQDLLNFVNNHKESTST